MTGSSPLAARRTRELFIVALTSAALLAVLYVVAVTGAVAATEVLKLHLLTRPQLDDIGGIAQNSLPSGHATIGMALSLGVVMVTPQRWRWAAVVGGVVVVLGSIVLVTTFSADARSTVEFAADHLVVCAVILAVGVAEVVGYHQLLRGLSLDAPNSSGGT